MSFLKGLLGGLSRERKAQNPLPDRRKDAVSGFYWGGSSVTPLAAGRGFNQEVVGESFHRDAIEKVTGGPTRYGVSLDVAAVLREVTYEGKPSIQVMIGGERCGVIPKKDLQEIVGELRSISELGKPVSAKAKISAGYEGGDYNVKLSIARPLKVRAK